MRVQPQPRRVCDTARVRFGMRLLVSVAALLLAACDHRVASELAIDVCALGLQPAAALLKEPATSTGNMRPPSAGYCQFTTQAGRNGPGRISVRVMTAASVEPDDLARTAEIMLAEAEQTWNQPGSDEFADVAKLAAAFGTGSGNARQVVIGERGVLMEIGIDDGGFGRDEVAALVTGLWTRVLDYEPPAP